MTTSYSLHGWHRPDGSGSDAITVIMRGGSGLADDSVHVTVTGETVRTDYAPPPDVLSDKDLEAVIALARDEARRIDLYNPYARRGGRR